MEGYFVLGKFCQFMHSLHMLLKTISLGPLRQDLHSHVLFNFIRLYGKSLFFILDLKFNCVESQILIVNVTCVTERLSFLVFLCKRYRN